MFGYIKPVKCELKIREFEHYRATYCGLCHALSKDYGFLARFLVNYDFTFLALVLEDAAPKYEKRRCVAHPFCKRSVCTACSSLSKTAAASVILSWWKLCDEVADDKSFFARIAKLFLKPAYKKAVAAMPEFDAVCREKLAELCALERDNSPSLDAVADTFASIVASLSELASSPRVMREFFYHIGRIIYLTDALADIADDLKGGQYNPIAARFGINTLPIDESVYEQVKAGIFASDALADSAISLISHPHMNLILNVLKLGIPAAVEAARAGKKPKKEKIHERSI